MNDFTAAFLLALALAAGVRLWLARRHVHHIMQHRQSVPREFADEISLAAHQKAADYSSTRTRFGVLHSMVDWAMLLVLTFGGLLQWLDSVARGWFDSPLLQGTALIALFTLVTSAVDLPLSYYRTFSIESRFGFNKMTRAMWAGDLIKQSVLAAALGLPLILVVLWLMQAMGALWWLYVWLVWIAFSVLVLAVYPAFIAPLFNKFSPMQEGSLKSRIEQLLAKCGFRSSGLFVMDGSRRSSHGNAYFTGFGKTKRIVFFDTLIARLNESEIEAVLAHELGHFKLNHVIRRMAWTFVVSLAFLALLGWVKDEAWFYQGLGVSYPASDAMALVLFMLVVPVFTFLLNPLAASYSRKHEFEADAYAARYSSARELVSALVKLYKDNASTLTPDPVHSAFYDSHPPARIRIERLQTLGPGNLRETPT
ncbi:MAG: M48 family metallopeptidase [Burkholderiales bacterium]|nr:M48 family metallopeptidase [Burkholderiales bacterium]